MLLENKVAVVYGAGGRVGGAVARAFAAEGAAVFLAGRTHAKLDRVADDIRSSGGLAETARIDALDEEAVDAFVDAVAEQTGRVDISFNLISYGDVQEPLATISAEDFSRPIEHAVRTQFLTTRAAARHMVKRSSGVILAFGGSGPEAVPGLGGFVVALDAVEGLRRQWACELGPHGIRFVTLKTGGIPESLPEDFPGRAEIVAGIEEAAMLHRAATLADVGNVAVFAASDLAGSMTAATVNISCGALVD
ncbi:SDR family oxidoreductase [Streptomyces sp. NPDC021096]|uniref:SDR family NAD(P)-dependent oxidoreductase n=1 Tax=Streptomyces sp. NPDC021096 TaxID=3154792 RepID=UPI0033ED3259